MEKFYNPPYSSPSINIARRSRQKWKTFLFSTQKQMYIYFLINSYEFTAQMNLLPNCLGETMVTACRVHWKLHELSLYFEKRCIFWGKRTLILYSFLVLQGLSQKRIYCFALFSEIMHTATYGSEKYKNWRLIWTGYFTVNWMINYKIWKN